jgi:hypothetical protein
VTVTTRSPDEIDRPEQLTMCPHHPACPSAEAEDRDAAHVVASHPEQGWSLLCNGVVLFEDCGEILPDGRCIDARRAYRPRVPRVA